MKTLITIAATAFVLAAGTLTASAGYELDKAVGAGSFIHPTGPQNGVWDAGEENRR